MPIIKNKPLGHWGPKTDGAFVTEKQFNDSGESPFFLRELEHIRTKIVEIVYVETQARQLIPVNTEANEGVDYITYRQMDKAGQAILIRDYTDNIPRADVVGAEFINNPVHSIAASYGYNRQEIRAANYAQKPLDQWRAEACRDAIYRKENDLALAGDAPSKLVGFLNNTVMSQVVLPSDGAGASSAWSTKTADQILRDLYLWVNSIVALTKKVEKPDTMLLPIDQLNLIKMKRIGIDSNMTVMRFFLETNGYIKDIDSVPQLSGAGAGPTDRGIIYKRDPDKLEMWVTMETQQYEPQWKGLQAEIIMESRFGGVLIYKPLSLAYVDGI